jgi:hypothetical protein
VNPNPERTVRHAPLRIALALLLLVSASGCMGMQGTYASPAAARGTAAALAGIWRVTQVNGQNLPAPSPQEPSVTVESASLLLAANGHYTLSITARRGAEAAATQSQEGTWTAAEMRLTVTPAVGRPTRFDYTLTAGTLTLRDGQVVYTLARG